jgi:chromosome segregation ATPase
MGKTNNRPTTFVVVALGSMWAGAQLIEEGEVLEVDRAVRSDWVGSKLARDATDAEIEAHRAEQGAVEDDDSLAADRAELIKEIKALAADRELLKENKAELAGDLEALEGDIADYEKRKVTLADEIAELEAAKAKAAKK